MPRQTKAIKPAARRPQPAPAPRRAASSPRPLFPAQSRSLPLSALCAAAMIVIIAYGFWLQMPGLSNPIVERLHGWRECQTAMTSRNFVRDGMNPLVARVDYIGKGQMQLEFPIYQYLVAVFYCIFGVHEIWGRIVSMLFGIGSAILLYQLGRMLWSRLVGLVAAAVFSWSPLDVYFNRSFLPDSSTICFTLLALWMFLRFFRDERPRDLWIACAAIAFALACKPPIAVTVAPPLAVALFIRYGFASWRQKRLNIGLAAAFVFFLGWQVYSYDVNNHKSDNLQEAGLSFTNAGQNNKELMDWYFGSHERRNSVDTYKRIFSRIPDWVGHWAPSLASTRQAGLGAVIEFICHYGLIGLALLGIALSWRFRMQWILLAWFLGCAAYIWIFLGVNYVHDYYQMPIIPMLALASAVAIDQFARLFAPFIIKPKHAFPVQVDSAIEPHPLPVTSASPRIVWRPLGTALAALIVLVFASAQAYAGYAVLRDFDPRAESWSPGQKAYWVVFTQFVTLGADIHKHLPEHPGLLALTGPASTVVDCRDPQLLYTVNCPGFVLQAHDDAMNAAEKEAMNMLRARRIQPYMVRSVKWQKSAEWLSPRFLTILDLAMKKGVRTLVVVSPQAALSQPVLAQLAQRHKLHYHDPAGQFDIYTLNP